MIEQTAAAVVTGTEMSFEDKLNQAIKNKILKEISSTDYTSISYQERIQIPKDTINKIWGSIEWDSVIEAIKPEIEKRVCNAIVGNMETEIKSDVKSILSIDGVRQRIRVEVFPKIMAIVDDEGSK